MCILQLKNKYCWHIRIKKPSLPIFIFYRQVLKLLLIGGALNARSTSFAGRVLKQYRIRNTFQGNTLPMSEYRADAVYTKIPFYRDQGGSERRRRVIEYAEYPARFPCYFSYRSICERSIF